MAHYALLDKNNIVFQVITGVDEKLIQNDLDGTQIGGSTESWEEFYATRPWLNASSCKRTSYNRKIRGNFAGIGFKYYADLDLFIPPKCHEEAILNVELANWDCESDEHKTLAI